MTRHQRAHGRRLAGALGVVSLTVTLVAAPVAASTAEGRTPSAVGLRPGDLPGDRTGPPGQGIWRLAEAGPVARCLHVRGDTPVAEVPSRTFSPATDLAARVVSSDVVVFARTRGARRVERALAGQAAAHCLQGPLRRSLAGFAPRGHLRLLAPVETTPLAVSPPGSPASFAYRVAVTAVPTNASEPPFSLYVDLLGFQEGRMVVELRTVSARQLFPAAREQDLLALLARRAGRH